MKKYSILFIMAFAFLLTTSFAFAGETCKMDGKGCATEKADSAKKADCCRKADGAKKADCAKKEDCAKKADCAKKEDCKKACDPSKCKPGQCDMSKCKPAGSTEAPKTETKK